MHTTGARPQHCVLALFLVEVRVDQVRADDGLPSFDQNICLYTMELIPRDELGAMPNPDADETKTAVIALSYIYLPGMLAAVDLCST